MSNPQAFDVGIGISEATGEEAPSSFQPVEFQWQFGTLISHWGGIGRALPRRHANRVRIGPE
jgi:hypothetical protein